MTPNSTKTPFLFCGDTIQTGGCGEVDTGTAEQLFFSIQKLINLPNETLLFSGTDDAEKNLSFSKYVEIDNPMIDAKLR